MDPQQFQHELNRMNMQQQQNQLNQQLMNQQQQVLAESVSPFSELHIQGCEHNEW
jgi:hypothetical protein